MPLVPSLFWKFYFFESNLRSMSPMPLVPRLFENSLFSFLLSFFFFEIYGNIFFFFFFFFFLRYEDLFIIKKWSRWRWRWSKSDENLFMMNFFFFLVENPILWMRISLAGSWCGLLDKSLLSSCKKIISISNGFFH